MSHEFSIVSDGNVLQESFFLHITDKAQTDFYQMTAYTVVKKKIIKRYKTYRSLMFFVCLFLSFFLLASLTIVERLGFKEL